MTVYVATIVGLLILAMFAPNGTLLSRAINISLIAWGIYLLGA